MNSKTAISALQELMAARRHPLPRYVEEGSGTDFKCTVYVEGIQAVGHAANKKGAKHESARKALEQLQGSQISVIEETREVERPLKNFVGELNEYSSRNGVVYPVYDFVTATVGGQFIYKCSFLGEEVLGRGMNKKDSKQDAAKNMLSLIDPARPLSVASKYKIIHEKTTLQTEDVSRIVTLFQNLSTNTQFLTPPDSPKMQTVSGIEYDEDDDIDELQEQLRRLKIEYNVQDLQKYPPVVCLIITNTQFTFLGTDSSRDRALKKVYKNVLEVKKSGCSLDVDLTRFF